VNKDSPTHRCHTNSIIGHFLRLFVSAIRSGYKLLQGHCEHSNENIFAWQKSLVSLGFYRGTTLQKEQYLSSFKMYWKNYSLIAIIVMALIPQSQQMRLPNKNTGLALTREFQKDIRQKGCKQGCSGEFTQCHTQATKPAVHKLCVLARDLCYSGCKKVNTLRSMSRLLKSVRSS